MALLKPDSPGAQNRMLQYALLGRTGAAWTLAVIGALAVLVLTPVSGRAGNQIVDLNQFQQTDLRAISMGNAFGALARGEDAMLYNPAGLPQYDLDLKIDLGVTLIGSQGNFATDTYALQGGSGVSAPQVQTYLTNYDGTTQRYIGQTLVSAVANLGVVNFGAGFANLDVQRYAFQFNQKTPGVVDFTPAGDSLTASLEHAHLQLLSAGFKLFSGKLLFGGTLKTVAYDQSVNTVSFFNLAASGKLDLQLAPQAYPTQTAYDVGFIYRMEILPALRPQLSVVGYNIGGVTLTSAGNPNLTVPDTYNVGLSFQPNLPLLHIIASFELEDVGGSITIRDPVTGKDHLRDDIQRTHAGIELGLIKTPTGNNILNVRWGVNRGQAVWGAELNLFGDLRLVYAHGSDDLGWANAPAHFDFDAYQFAFGIAW